MKLLLCAGLALASAPAFAQSNTTSQPATASLAAEPTVAAIAPSKDNILRAGTGVSVRLLEELTTEWVDGATGCLAAYCGEVRLIDNFILIELRQAQFI